MAVAPASVRSPARSSRRVTLPVLALTLLLPAGASAAVRPDGPASVATTQQGNRAATHTFLKADYELTKATLASTHAVEATEGRAATALGHECKDVLEGGPDESVIEEESPSTQGPKLSGRAQGERARSQQESQTIDLEIDETILAADYRVERRPYEAFIAATERLTWGDPTINVLVHQEVTRLQEDLLPRPVAACPEMRAWAASGFHRLPPASKRLKESRETRDKQIEIGNLEVLLRSYEGRAERAIAERTDSLKDRIREEERTDERRSSAVYHMKLALGEKVSWFVKQQFAHVIDKGRTSAGTTFVIRTSVGERSSRSCRHEVEIEIHEDSGGSGGGVCVSEGAHSQPSGMCSGSVETVELATPPAARRARVRLNNGRTVTVPVVQVPPKYGGPAGVFIDAFRGHNSYPVSLQELGSNERVLRTVSLGRVRCMEEAATEAPGPPRFVNLATVTAPSGESLTISGTLLRFHEQTEFSLESQQGIRNSKTAEEHGKPQFQWRLSTECAPHPYSLLAGILPPPGASVFARTAAGLAPLTKVELAPSMHAEGPLFYGIYATPPTEIIVEDSDGSLLYTESLAAKATEETEFCEGYAEQ